MLLIEIMVEGQPGLAFANVEKYGIPSPPLGFSSEINGVAVMQFEDEQQAIDYAHDLDEYAESIKDHSSPKWLMICDIIKAISDDDFVRTYIYS